MKAEIVLGHRPMFVRTISNVPLAKAKFIGSIKASGCIRGDIYISGTKILLSTAYTYTYVDLRVTTPRMVEEYTENGSLLYTAISLLCNNQMLEVHNGTIRPRAAYSC